MYDINSGEDELSDHDSDTEVYENLHRTWTNPDPFRGVYSNPYTQTDGEEITFRVGQVFGDVSILRNALRDYAIKSGYKITRLKNDNLRLIANWATQGCPQRIHASRLANEITFMVKTFQDEHTCIRLIENRNSNTTTKWIAEKMMDSLRVDLEIGYELMNHNLMAKWRVDAPICQLYRARCYVKEKNFGMIWKVLKS